MKMMLLVGFLLGCTLAGAQTGIPNGTSATAQDQQITNDPVAEVVADSSATIGWSLREGSGKASIKYGSDRRHLSQTAEAVPGNDRHNFHARLEGLAPETRYYFQIMQKDEPVGGVGTFITVASGAAPIKSKATIPQ